MAGMPPPASPTPVTPPKPAPEPWADINAAANAKLNANAKALENTGIPKVFGTNGIKSSNKEIGIINKAIYLIKESREKLNSIKLSAEFSPGRTSHTQYKDSLRDILIDTNVALCIQVFVLKNDRLPSENEEKECVYAQAIKAGKIYGTSPMSEEEKTQAWDTYKARRDKRKDEARINYINRNSEGKLRPNFTPENVPHNMRVINEDGMGRIIYVINSIKDFYTNNLAAEKAALANPTISINDKKSLRSKIEKIQNILNTDINEVETTYKELFKTTDDNTAYPIYEKIRSQISVIDNKTYDLYPDVLKWEYDDPKKKWVEDARTIVTSQLPQYVSGKELTANDEHAKVKKIFDDAVKENKVTKKLFDDYVDSLYKYISILNDGRLERKEKLIIIPPPVFMQGRKNREIGGRRTRKRKLKRSRTLRR